MAANPLPDRQGIARPLARPQEPVHPARAAADRDAHLRLCGHAGGQERAHRRAQPRSGNSGPRPGGPLRGLAEFPRGAIPGTERGLAAASIRASVLLVVHIPADFSREWQRAGRPRCNSSSTAAVPTPLRSSPATPSRSSTITTPNCALDAGNGRQHAGGAGLVQPQPETPWSTVPSLVAILMALEGLW